MKKIEQEIQELEIRANKARLKLQEKKEKYENTVALPSLRKSVGKCFKYINSYGNPYPKWPLYLQIVAINEKDLHFECVEFQKTSMNIIEIKLDKKFNWNGESYFGKNNGYVEISRSEYNRAKKSLLKTVLSIFGKPLTPTSSHTT